MGLIKRAKDNYFILGGIDSRDFDMIVSCDDAFAVPERDVDTYEVPGRNGDLIVDNGRFRNIDITYDVVIGKDFPEKINAFKRAIGTLRGYVRLEDTFDPDVYRMASVDKVRIKELGSRYNSGTFAITLNCKPQKFLKSGEDEIAVWFANVVKKSESGLQYDSMSSGDFKFPEYIDREMELTMHCPSGVEVAIICTSMNDNNVVVDTQNYTCVDGDSITLEFYSTARYGNIELRATDITGVSATLDCQIVRDYDPDDTTPYSIPMVDNLVLENPTGYATRPLLEFSGLAEADINIVNRVGGVVDETYRIKCMEDEPGTITVYDRAYLDCDLMYMYSGGGDSLADRIQIITAVDKSGRNLVFPEFGTETIEIKAIETPHSDMTLPEWLPVVYITPRWWTI